MINKKPERRTHTLSRAEYLLMAVEYLLPTGQEKTEAAIQFINKRDKKKLKAFGKDSRNGLDVRYVLLPADKGFELVRETNPIKTKESNK